MKLTKEVDEHGNIFYFNELGQLHREDGPAIEYADGSKEWHINDKRHREDGPAIEYADGGKAWWINGKRHREDGPAIEYADGGKEWLINGNHMTEQVFNDFLLRKRLQRIIDL
jgi:hypothetical protein